LDKLEFKSITTAPPFWGVYEDDFQKDLM